MWFVVVVVVAVVAFLVGLAADQRRRETDRDLAFERGVKKGVEQGRREAALHFEAQEWQALLDRSGYTKGEDDDGV